MPDSKGAWIVPFLWDIVLYSEEQDLNPFAADLRALLENHQEQLLGGDNARREDLERFGILPSKSGRH